MENEELDEEEIKTCRSERRVETDHTQRVMEGHTNREKGMELSW